MRIDISTSEFIKYLDQFSYKESGDSYENIYGDRVIDIFKNSEIFWRYFVVPSTMRLFNKNNISSRNEVSADLRELFRLNYSIFVNIIYADKCLVNMFTGHISAFENFYTHLGTACELSEMLLSEFYLTKLTCTGQKTEILQYLTKTKFRKIADEWYDKYYPNTYEYYMKKGKHPPINLISRINILDEYFGEDPSWKSYLRFANNIRTYRNVIVHNPLIGGQINDNKHYVPKKEKISNYKKWDEIFAVKSNSKKFEKDFIVRETQMNNDLILIKENLNAIWDKLINEFHQLLYVDKNKVLLEKYDLHFEK